MRVAILTANTAVYKEQEEDKSGKVLKALIEDANESVVFTKALPLDRKVLSTIMERMSDGELADLILVTGGSGCGPKDITPEATLDVVERQVVGIPEAMRAHMMSITKRAMLNRCVAGIRGKTLIVNLPGKAGAAKEAVSYMLPELVHAVDVIKGE